MKFIIILIFLYFLISFLYLYEDSLKVDYTEIRGYEDSFKNLTTKEIWISILWPIRFFWYILKGIIITINLIFALILKAIGINYINSYKFREINRKFY